jgi:hypothetical protein
MRLSILMFLVFLAGCTHKAMTNDTKSGSIEGRITIGPLRPGPVRADQPEPEVPPELFASHKIVVLSQDGKTTIVESKPDSKGNYKVDVPAGTYLVDVQPHDIGMGNFTPQEVVVEAGQTVHHDIDIDTGMR